MSEAEARLRPLMVASLDGDAAAYRDLLRELTGYLRAYYRCRVAYGAADAEDLIQETLIAIHSRRSSYDRSQPFTAWVYAMARYKLIDYLRKRRVRAAVPLDETDDLFAADETEHAAASQDLEQLLADLPASQREAIRLTKIEGLSIDEAALRTGQSASATKVGIHRGLKRLRLLWSRGDSDAND